RVRLFTRNGHDWTDRYPRIVEAALRNRNSFFVLDGEAVLLDADGISDFNPLHSRKRDAEVQLYAFDCLAADGDYLRRLPLSLRKTNLARLGNRRGVANCHGGWAYRACHGRCGVRPLTFLREHFPQSGGRLSRKDCL